MTHLAVTDNLPVSLDVFFCYEHIEQLINAQMVWVKSEITSQTKNGPVSRGTLVIFVWATIGQKILTRHNSTKNENIVL